MHDFIDPVLGMKMLVFVKTCPKRSFSIQSVPRDAGFSLFWMNRDIGIYFLVENLPKRVRFYLHIKYSRRVFTAYPNSASTEKCIVPIQPFYWRREKGFKARERDKKYHYPALCLHQLTAAGGGGGVACIFNSGKNAEDLSCTCLNSFVFYPIHTPLAPAGGV